MSKRNRILGFSFLTLLTVTLCLPAQWGGIVEAKAQQQKIFTQRVDIQIHGGYKADPKKSPWQVALVFFDTIHPVDGLFCGGTLLDSQWVLTAAHCLYDPMTCTKRHPQELYVIYGTANIAMKKIPPYSIPAELHIPIEYDCNKKEYDIALIRLKEPAAVDSYVVLPVQTATPIPITPGLRLSTSGWGLTDGDQKKSSQLMEVEIPVIAYSTCKNHYGAILPDGVICAGEAGKDACKGDSGGPLFLRGPDDRVIQLGIVSFGDGCGSASAPGVYTSVTEYLGWIVTIRRPVSCTTADIAAKIC